jgi:hypothetical protein
MDPMEAALIKPSQFTPSAVVNAKLIVIRFPTEAAPGATFT